VLLVFALAAAAGTLAVVYGRVSRQRAAMLRVQEECLRYQPPADQVVYEEEPARAAELLKGGTIHTPVPTGGSPQPPIAGHASALWPLMWRYAWPAGPPAPAGAILFLHERRTLTDKRVLVCVQADRVARKLRVTLVHPGSTRLDPILISDVAVVPRPREGLLILHAGPDPFADKLPPVADPGARSDLRFFAGEPDADDPTSLTIRYESAGRSGVVAMWLQDEQTVQYVDRLFASR
jgi:hypothetical protein